MAQDKQMSRAPNRSAMALNPKQIQDLTSNIESEIRPLARQFGRMNANKDEIQFGREVLHIMELVRKGSDLHECSPDSFREAILNVAAVGLTLNPIRNHAYLVARWNKHTKKKEATLMVGYQGYIHAATSSGAVKRVTAENVHAGDDFQIIKGSQTEVRHTIARGPRGAYQGTYCYYVLPSDESDVVWITAEEMKKIQESAETQKIWSGPFIGEMRKKSAVRRARKLWGSNARLDVVEDIVRRTEPHDFERHPEADAPKPDDKEPIVVLSEKDIATLHDILMAADIEALQDRQKWLNRLALANGYNSVDEIPQIRFPSIREQLVAGIQTWKEKQDK